MELHFLDARGTLTDIREWLHHCLTETHEKAAALMPLQPLDVVVQTEKCIIPEKGLLGYARSRVWFSSRSILTTRHLRPRWMPRLNGCSRMSFITRLGGTGQATGTSLGEALVSEGLAGHFVLELFGGLPEPWEQLTENEIRTHATLAAQEWERTDYNHDAWFFGRGDLPRWLGYSLGFRLVERFLSEHPNSRASNLVGAVAQDFQSMLTLV